MTTEALAMLTRCRELYDAPCQQQLKSQMAWLRENNNKRQRVTTKQKTTVNATAGRHPIWSQEHAYRLVRKGEPIESLEVLRERARSGDLCLERDVYIFRHCDASRERNVHLPLFEAVHRVCDKWIVAQKGHLHAMYRKAGRVDRSRAWDMVMGVGDADATTEPYWVDRYAYSACARK